MARAVRNLVTGGLGFLGSHLIDRLINAGEEVICIDNAYTGRKINVIGCWNNPLFEFIRHDVTDPLRLEVDRIWHLACPASPIHYQFNPIKTAKTNFLGTYNMLGLATRINAKMQKNSVISLVLSSYKEKIYPIDNLNTTETGLLLFTNDDALAKKIRNRNQKIQSIYQVTLDKKLSQIDLEKIKNGISFNGKKYTFDSISYIKQKEKNDIGIEHSKGGIKYIKDVFKKLNYCIQKLDRVAIGGLTKKNLPRKHYRNLSKQEINILKRL